MRFDDRLTTVLNQPAADPRDRAVRWRQLVDLVARAGGQSGNQLVDRALQVIAGDRDQVDEALRAAAARAIAGKDLPLPLVELFAADRLTVSAPLLAAVRLDIHEWRRLAEAADEETRNFIFTLHPDLVARAADCPQTKDSAADPPVEDVRAVEAARPEPAAQIGDVVARLEKLRREPERRPARFPAGDVPAFAPIFRWECGPSGEITWVEGVPRGPLIGRSIGRAEEGEGVAEDVQRAFALRAPFREARLRLAGEGAVAGDWKISGVPAFHPANGRFEGYRGVALREGPGGHSLHLSHEAVADPDSLRELVHEIKTPLNAIIGFAEIIDGQYLGPAARLYRDRAAEIVAQARLLLSAIDDLDFAAKLQAEHDRPGTGTDLAALVEQIAARMSEGAGNGAPRIELIVQTKWRRCALDPALAERLVERFCRALVAFAADGDRIELVLDSETDECLLWCSEARLGGQSGGDQLGFALRVVRGLAHIASGDLIVSGGRIALVLPQL